MCTRCRAWISFSNLIRMIPYNFTATRHFVAFLVYLCCITLQFGASKLKYARFYENYTLRLPGFRTCGTLCSVAAAMSWTSPRSRHGSNAHGTPALTRALPCQQLPT